MQLMKAAADLPQNVINWIERWLLDPIDARVYAAVRITYGIMALGIVLELWSLREYLFNGDGMSYHRPDLLFYIVLKWIRSSVGVSALMVVAGIAASMVIVGLFTRAALVVLYFWNFAYCAIGYPAEAGYDGINRIVGFVLLLGPPMRAWSLEARLGAKAAPDSWLRRFFGPRGATESRYALRLLQWQLAIIYIATVWLKAPDAYWRRGDLMAYFMMSMYSNFPFPIWAWLGKTSVLMTWYTLIAETTIPFALVLAQNDRFYRRLAFALGLGLHGGIAITSTIGMFSLSMMPLYAAFLVPEDIDEAAALLARLRRKSSAPSASPAPTAESVAKAAKSVAKVAKS
jgi:Vitamin K-dependent gamma-carboxylase